MFKNMTAITTATLIALAIAPANATHKDGPHGDSQFIEALLNLAEPKVIFVSPMSHDGDLDGLAGADKICQDLADDPASIVPEGEYVALLSTDDVHGSARLTPSSGPYIRSDGAFVAADSAALFSTVAGEPARNLINGVIKDETGVITGGTNEVWTGTRIGGIGSGDDCDGWTSGLVGQLGSTGFLPSKSTRWLETASDLAEFPSRTCDVGRHIYCVQR